MRVRIVLILAAAALAAGCGDDLGPLDWETRPDTVLLFSLARPEFLGLPSAYDFHNLRRVAVESPAATGTWDVALSEASGGFVLLPAGVFAGADASAAIAVDSVQPFDQVRRAPGDTASFRRTQGVPVHGQRVYIVRTRALGALACVRYAKGQVVDADSAGGSVRFMFVANPNCNDRALVPPSKD
ncbi:MAG: hypothetical protein HY703_00310 [Gemmatimonadetes bacterium]|nr:hypothetical protein [Gemmatimonadota bacterium]